MRVTIKTRHSTTLHPSPSSVSNSSGSPLPNDRAHFRRLTFANSFGTHHDIKREARCLKEVSIGQLDFALCWARVCGDPELLLVSEDSSRTTID
ncbi:hypothetical protein BaRGS_00006042 [Batillaria attramentaria]|uniref:Uncharacterized protein n=1 Tax=Batillaria attramentaria TaxID=370345 RepID=A0ABD0LU26_9CAEN